MSTTHAEDYVLQQIEASGLPEKISQALHFLEEFKERHRSAMLLEDEIVSLELLPEQCRVLGLACTMSEEELTERIRTAAEKLKRIYLSPVDPPVCALRSVPMDMIARSVLQEVGGRQNLTTEGVLRALIAIWDRYDGRSYNTQADVDRILSGIQLVRRVDENSDVVDLFAASSFVPHNGTARLRDGG